MILLGNEVIDNQPSESMINFLEQYDFSGLDVAPYWVGGMDHDDKSGCTKSFSVKDCFQVQDGSYAGTGGSTLYWRG